MQTLTKFEMLERDKTPVRKRIICRNTLLSFSIARYSLSPFANARLPIRGAMFPWRRHVRIPLRSFLLETTKGFKWIGNCNKLVCNKVKI